jgi:signal transduction histidine kinase
MVLSANRQMHLVEDLLMLTRLDNDLTAPRLVPINLASVVRRVAAELEGTYPGQRIDLDGSSDLHALADPDRTTQVLANLMDNAAKYSPEGSAIGVAWRREGAMVIVCVRDEGSGIPEESIVRLFKRFGRIPGSRIRSGHVGTGLGLYLGRQLARAMGGELDLESTGQSGSTFRVRLPAPSA